MDANGVMIRRYVPLPGPDETLAMVDSTGVSYPLVDSRGKPMAKSPRKWALANGTLRLPKNYLKHVRNGLPGGKLFDQ